MPVVFDEIEANVVPENPVTAPETTHNPQSKESESEKLRYQLRHQLRRAARLRVD